MMTILLPELQYSNRRRVHEHKGLIMSLTGRAKFLFSLTLVSFMKWDPSNHWFR